MKSLIITAGATALLSACAAPEKIGSMHRSEPNYELRAECGSRLVIFIAGDSTLQQRINLNINTGPVPVYLVKNSIKIHPAINYLNLVEDHVGTAKISALTKELAPEVASLGVTAKDRLNGDMILANKEVVPVLLEDASRVCKRAGYNFSELRSLALNITAGSASEKLSKSEIQDKKIAVQHAEIEKTNAAIREKALLAEIIEKIRSSIRPATAQEKKGMTLAIERTLIDPESARYRDSYVIPGGSACIEVNSKNRMGGYVGFRMAILSRVDKHWISIDGGAISATQCIKIITEIETKSHIKTDAK